MKRNKASNKATRVARYTNQTASAGTANVRSDGDSPLKRLFGRQNRLYLKPSYILTRANELSEMRQLLSYVNNAIDSMNRESSIKTSTALRRRSRFDFSLRCFDDVPKIR
jgi:ribosomal protein S20